MAAVFDPRRATGNNLNDDQVIQALGDGNFSDIEDFEDDDDEIQRSILENLQVDNLLTELEPEPLPSTAPESESIQDTRGSPQPTPRPRSSRPPPRKRIWKQVPFHHRSHEYTSLPVAPVRTPMEYFSDYFDRDFFDEVARCTNLYHHRKTGLELNLMSVEVARVFSIHIIMGCIPYPRIPMYWRSGLKLNIITEQMARDRFLTVRNALHVVDSDEAPPRDRNNPLWKVQPMIDRVKAACNKLERVPGFYSIDEQMIPFTGRCILRQVVRNKPRPVGLKNFVLTTSEGLMLDFYT